MDKPQNNDALAIRTHIGCDTDHMTTVLGLPKYGGDAMVQAIEAGLALPQRATRKLYGQQRRLIAAERLLPPLVALSVAASGSATQPALNLYLRTRYPRFYVELLDRDADLTRFHPQEIRETALDGCRLAVVAWIDDPAAVTEQQLASAMDEARLAVEAHLEVPFMEAPPVSTNGGDEERSLRPEELPED